MKYFINPHNKLMMCLICFVLLSLSFLPKPIFAESLGNTEVLLKVKPIKDITVKSENIDLTFNENTIFYVKQTDNSTIISIGDNDIEIEQPSILQFLESISLSDLDHKDEKIVGTAYLLNETKLYADETMKEEQGTVWKVNNLPVFFEGDNFIKVKIGYQYFYIPKKDVNYVKNEEVNPNDSDINETLQENEKDDNKDGISNELNENEQTKTSDGEAKYEQPENESEARSQDNKDVNKNSQVDNVNNQELTENPQEADQNNQELPQSKQNNIMITKQPTVTSQLAKATSVQFGKFFKVSTNNVSVYDNSTGKLVKVGQLVKGQVYQIDSIVGNWHRIKFGNIYGYVWKEATEPADASSLKNINKGEKNSGRTITALTTLTVYDNTSGSLVPFGTIEAGKEYPIISKTGNWYKIDYAGRIGYIYASAAKLSFASSDQYFKVLENNVSVYDNSSGKLVKVGSLTKGQVYPIVSIVGNWHRIKFGNIYGYVWKEATEPADASSLKNINKGEKNSGRTITALTTLTVYDNTSGSLVPFGTIEAGKEYPIISKTGNWYKIDYAGRIGYIYASAAKLSFASSDQYFKVLENNVSIYDNSSGKLVKVGSLTKGQVYPIVSIVGNWHRIKFGNIYGYVWKDATEPVFSFDSSLINKAKNSGRGFKALTNLTVYTRGNSDYFGVIDKDVTYPYIKKTGNWYEIDFAGRTGYVYAPATEETTTYSYYNLTLSEMLAKQMKVRPQTQSIDHAYVHSGYIQVTNNGTSGKVTENVLNVRTTPEDNGDNNKAGQLKEGDTVQIIGKVGVWYKIRYSANFAPGWKDADQDDVLYYLNPNNFLDYNGPGIFQFLKLDRYTGLTAADINKNILTMDKGILAGKGEAFVTAAKTYNVNEIYLITHALHETGNGKSILAKGVTVNGQKVYNMYGIGATDNCSITCGSQYAYNQGWTTPEKAIIGGAKFIADDYVHIGQDTLYKMRWNPANPATHQYATSIHWALTQARSYKTYYSMFDSYMLYFDIPVYK